MAQINPYLTFNGNCEGGKISIPMEQTIWGAYFGMFTDQFNINWMINYDAPTAG